MLVAGLVVFEIYKNYAYKQIDSRRKLEKEARILETIQENRQNQRLTQLRIDSLAQEIREMEQRLETKIKEMENQTEENKLKLDEPCQQNKAHKNGASQ